MGAWKWENIRDCYGMWMKRCWILAAAEKNGVQAVLRAYGVEPDAEKIACYSRINDSLWKACERGEITRDHILESRFPLFFKELGVEGDGLAAERLYRKQLDESRRPHRRGAGNTGTVVRPL